jgi:hypothetical protein
MKENKLPRRLSIIAGVTIFLLCLLIINELFLKKNNNQLDSGLVILDSTINKIVFVNQDKINTSLVEKFLTEKLGRQYNRDREGSSIIIEFDAVNDTTDLSYNFISTDSSVRAKVNIIFNFDPQAEKYRYEDPAEGFTFLIKLTVLEINEADISAFIFAIIKSYLPVKYDRDYYFKDKDKEREKEKNKGKEKLKPRKSDKFV